MPKKVLTLLKVPKIVPKKVLFPKKVPKKVLKKALEAVGNLYEPESARTVCLQVFPAKYQLTDNCASELKLKHDNC